MENKKTIIGIIIVVILIIGLIVASYLYSDFNKKQLNLLTDETNTILKNDILTEGINLETKSEKNYATVEKAIKEYLLKLKNIYSNIDETYNQINPNDIFSAKNIEDKNFEEVDAILANYKEKGENSILEYKELTKEENISNNIKDKNITSRTDYYINLYDTVMLSDVMKEKYASIENEIERKKDDLNNKIEKLGKIEDFLKENDKYWSIKDDKIQFNNVNKMTEYYNLLNKIED